MGSKDPDFKPDPQAEAEWIAARDLERHAPIAQLGPDVLADDFDAAEALRRLRACGRTAIAEVLLDQRVMAGIGNVYKSEVLFLARVSPFAPVHTLSDDELARIIAHARRVLAINAAPGAPGRRRTLSRLDPRERAWVYKRAGRPCRTCGAPIQFARTGEYQRGTYWCEGCQSGRDRHLVS